MAVIGIIATLDTKSEEASFLKKCIEKRGHQALLIDTGMLHPPGTDPDISRQKVFGCADEGELGECIKHGKSELQRIMTTGLGNKLVQLQGDGIIQGVISIGGGQGTAISTKAMQKLPIGFPKVMISTVACGTALFGDYVGYRDIVMIPAIVDICGINEITSVILSSGCGAVIGMAESALNVRDGSRKPVVAMTMAGVTTACVMQVKKLLDEKGVETIVCHTNVAGTATVDEMAKTGKISAVLDITTHEISGYLFGGLMAGNQNRFTNVYKSGIPVISVPGASDFLLRGPVEGLDKALQERKYYKHTPFHTHVRTSKNEMYMMGRFLAEVHNKIKGRNEILIPLQGFSQQNKKGCAIYDEEANQGFVDGVMESVDKRVKVHVCDMHINDDVFAMEIVKELEGLL